MKAFGLLLLLAASCVNTAFGKANLYTGWARKNNNASYPDLTAQVGDSITFVWADLKVQNVFIHPTQNCLQTGRIPIGNKSPTAYTFTPEDGAEGGNPIFFASDVGENCEDFGVNMIVNVFPNEDCPPIAVPTEPPVVSTDAPAFPSLPPTNPPVIIVITDAPVDPTDAPISPTAPPTWKPTGTPTTPDVSLSAPPTKNPTARPTTGVPTVRTPNQKTMRGLQMTLVGIDSFSEKTKEGWTQETQAFCTSYYENDYEGSTFRTSIAVTNFVISSNGRRSMTRSGRKLQTGDVIITYNQVVSFEDTGDAAITKVYLAKVPFATPDQRDDYMDSFQNLNDSVLEAVTDSSPVTFADEIAPTSVPINTDPQPIIDPDDGGLPLAAIIGIGCGGGAVLIIAILFCIYCRAKKSKDSSRREESPPTHNVAIKADDVSTLAGPSVAGKSPLYGDRSIETVDYDYSKAYEDRDHSVSYAGGTLGSDTQDFSFPANAGATGAALGPYDGNGSFDDNFGQSGGKVKEEILHIFAPPGKLGVVIDTPDDGAPVVHAVKETSVVVDKVKVGDKLVAVDDEDVRTLTAIKVSKLISRKSANTSRKLTVLRLTHIG